tara:strand:+ start:10339 stop:11427 length:1089 start_codon:yes stop_codon:yes gene_type:complete
MTLKKRVKILMISSSSSLGGGTKHMFTLGENLHNDFKIFYAMPKNNNFLNYLNKENFLEISERKINLKDILNLKDFIKLNSIDIIHAHGKGAGAISRIIKLIKNKPLIYTFHGIHLKCHNWDKRLFYVIYEYLTGWIDSIKILVSNSEKNYAQASKIYLGNKSLIINNGVSDRPIKNSINVDNRDFKFTGISTISICRFVEQKNINEILNIAINLPKHKFYIIGNGPLWQKINFLITKNKLKNVFLLGKKKDIFKYLYASDIYLSTSLYEGLPISILEAMSIGLPVVASNVIGNSDTIENGKSGFLYELHDISSASYYIEKLSKNIALMRKMGFAAFKRQRKFFSEKLMISKYSDLYVDQIR